MVKKNKSSKKKQNKEVKDALPEVDKEFYEIQIADLNKKLTRLRAHAAELETSYDDAMANFKKLDEDRADIIAYLKRTVQQKLDEIAELAERNSALRKSSDATIKKLQEQIEDMKLENKQTFDRMLAEIKLLNGKLASLEEFRAAREELNNKFVIQEQTMKEQEEKYHQIIYSLQKEHMLSKNKLRKEMEDKLIKLSTDFHKTTQNQIASTTQNLIQENIAINNELFLLIGSWQLIHDENEKLTSQLKDASLDTNLAKDQLDETLLTNITLRQILDKLTFEYNRITSFAEEHVHDKNKIKILEQRHEEFQKEKRNLLFEAQKLKQEKHALMIKIDEMIVNFNKIQCHNSKLERIIHKATLVVKEGIGLENVRTTTDLGPEEAEIEARKKSLMQILLDILSEVFILISIPADGDASIPTNTSDEWLKKLDYFKEEET
ncbi:cilia- and flagella-associated protein 157-like isoform X2 [Rhodnius prolixus]|uniref:cilia- and flagella-associated protein 157-like isoform X2 n=1 Tax=Rhodnius prolixus TaxID=13249 RepID=UPI003D18C3BE